MNFVCTSLMKIPKFNTGNKCEIMYFMLLIQLKTMTMIWDGMRIEQKYIICEMRRFHEKHNSLSAYANFH